MQPIRHMGANFMPINRREFNKQETVNYIRTTFLKLYAKVGIQSITIDMLCKECGIARSTFYHYFNDKYEVLEEIEDQLLDGLRKIYCNLSYSDVMNAQIGIPFKEVSKAICFMKENRTAICALLGKNGDSNFEYRWRKDIMDKFMGCFGAEKRNSSVDGVACAVFASSLIGLYRYYLFEKAWMSDDEFAIIIGTLLKYFVVDFRALALAE